MTPATDSGIVKIASRHSVNETVERIKAALHAKGIKLFAVVDHSGEAEAAGMQMLPTKLLIFGDPKAGTPLMVAVPSTAIDLPMKLLVTQDADGKVWISYNSFAYIQRRHHLPQEVVGTFNSSGLELLAAKAGD